MRKRDDKARFLVLYGCILMVFGLGIILLTVKITNKKILANSNSVVQDALAKIEENEKIMLRNSIYVEEYTNGFSKINIDDNKKEEINFKLKNDIIVSSLIYSKKINDNTSYLSFNGGKFNNEEKIKSVILIDNSFQNDVNKILEKCNSLFNESITYENVEKILNSMDKDIYSFYEYSILKVNSVYENGMYIDIFIDEIYPENPENYEQYSDYKFVDYVDEEIISTYKLTVDNNYKYVSLERYVY